MAQLKIAVDDFNLNASWTCYYRWPSGASWYNVWQSDAVATKQVTFPYELPENSVVKSAKVHSTWSGSLYGIKTNAINGIEPDADGFVEIDCSDATGTSLSVEFVFEASTDNIANNHDLDGVINGGEEDQTYTVGSHTSSVKVSDIYLLLEYESAYTPPELLPYTDPNPIVGATYVKAVHMTELHENVNRLRIAKGLAAYAFTDITAMQTMLAGWNAHVLEIRAALDEVSANHEAWLALGVNCPRLDVLMQLRSMVEVLAA